MNIESKIIIVNFTGPNRGVVKSLSNKPRDPRGPRGGKRLPKPTEEIVFLNLCAKKAA